MDLPRWPAHSGPVMGGADMPYRAQSPRFTQVGLHAAPRDHSTKRTDSHYRNFVHSVQAAHCRHVCTARSISFLPCCPAPPPHARHEPPGRTIATSEAGGSAAHLPPPGRPATIVPPPTTLAGGKITTKKIATSIYTSSAYSPIACSTTSNAAPMPRSAPGMRRPPRGHGRPPSQQREGP